MNLTTKKAGEFSFKQCKNDGILRKDETFDAEVVDISGINNSTAYYAGFLFIPSIAEHFWWTGTMTASEDSPHCQVVLQSYGTIFEVVVYNANNHIIPVLIYHLVSTEFD